MLTACDKRKLHNSFKKLRKADPNFTIKEVVQDSGIGLKSASYKTFVRCIKKMGDMVFTQVEKRCDDDKRFQPTEKICQRNEDKNL